VLLRVSRFLFVHFLFTGGVCAAKHLEALIIGSVLQTPTSPYLCLGTWWVVGGWECDYVFP